MVQSTCYVCGLKVEPTEPHMGSTGADGMHGARHLKGDPACLPVVEHAANTLALQAYNLGLILDRCSYTSPVYAAVEAAQKELLARASEVMDYL